MERIYHKRRLDKEDISKEATATCCIFQFHPFISSTYLQYMSSQIYFWDSLYCLPVITFLVSFYGLNGILIGNNKFYPTKTILTNTLISISVMPKFTLWTYFSSISSFTLTSPMPITRLYSNCITSTTWIKRKVMYHIWYNTYHIVGAHSFKKRYVRGLCYLSELAALSMNLTHTRLTLL